MKKTTTVLTLTTMLFGTFFPIIQGVAETTKLSEVTNGVRQVQASEKSTEGNYKIGANSTRPINNADGTVDFLGKTWNVIKDYGNGSRAI